MSASLLHSSCYVFVVVIDIGTSESGIVYSSKYGFEKDPQQIHRSYGKYSIPTCVLFTKCRTFKAFGLEAEDQYSEHVEDNTYNDVYFFNRIIMDLFKEEVNGEFCLEDQTGKRMASMDVLAACIRYLRDFIFDILKEPLISSDIRWVLPVPDAWNNERVTFMRSAAVNAGIPIEHIQIVKESEAALQYCCLPNDEIIERRVRHSAFQEGHFLLLNVNQLAANISVHLAQLNSHILELYQTKVENFGNTPLEKCLAEIFGSNVMDSYKASNELDYTLFTRQLKAKFERQLSTIVYCLMPPTLVQYLESKRRISFAGHKTACYEGCEIRIDKVRIKKDTLKHIFRKIYEDIVRSIQRTFDLFRLLDLSAVVIVGDFSENRVLHEVIREAYPDKQIIVPKNAELAVLTGAAVYGHHVLSGKINLQPTEKKRFSHH